MLTSSPSNIICDFSNETDKPQWYIVDDVVMGGRSNGSFTVTDKGHGRFYGIVSTENNGGFSSVRHQTKMKDVAGFSTIKIRLKGDGKKYQFRVRSDYRERHSYVALFQTSGEWETIEIPFQEMIPTFRGYRLNIPNYPGKELDEVAFLISNKVGEEFNLLIDWIALE